MANKKETNEPRPTHAGSEAARGIEEAKKQDTSAGNRAGEGDAGAHATPVPSRQGDGDMERA